MSKLLKITELTFARSMHLTFTIEISFIFQIVTNDSVKKHVTNEINLDTSAMVNGIESSPNK